MNPRMTRAAVRAAGGHNLLKWVPLIERDPEAAFSVLAIKLQRHWRRGWYWGFTCGLFSGLSISAGVLVAR